MKKVKELSMEEIKYEHIAVKKALASILIGEFSKIISANARGIIDAMQKYAEAEDLNWFKENANINIGEVRFMTYEAVELMSDPEKSPIMNSDKVTFYTMKDLAAQLKGIEDENVVDEVVRIPGYNPNVTYAVVREDVYITGLDAEILPDIDEAPSVYVSIFGSMPNMISSKIVNILLMHISAWLPGIKRESKALLGFVSDNARMIQAFMSGAILETFAIISNPMQTSVLHQAVGESSAEAYKWNVTSDLFGNNIIVLFDHRFDETYDSEEEVDFMNELMDDSFDTSDEADEEENKSLMRVIEGQSPEELAEAVEAVDSEKFDTREPINAADENFDMPEPKFDTP